MPSPKVAPIIASLIGPRCRRGLCVDPLGCESASHVNPAVRGWLAADKFPMGQGHQNVGRQIFANVRSLRRYRRESGRPSRRRRQCGRLRHHRGRHGPWPTDTIVVVDGTVLGQPRDANAAAAMLLAVSGVTHRVVTGVAV